MVFSSFPVYLDHPNLHQLQQAEHHHQGAGGCTLENQQLPTAPQPPSAVGGGLGSIRPGSMVDRARLAKIPLPEAGKKCPRCDSTHTKFCYFNNYSLSQPRHFCKTCRRYWTSGGALRNVPVGGGCRRNKRSKSNNNSSKSGSAGAATSSEMKHTTDGGSGTHLSQMQPPPPPLMATSTFNLSSGNLNGFHQAPPQPQLMIANGSGGGGIGEIGFHYPYLGGFELLGSHTNLYPNFQSEGVEASSSLSSPSKLEENGQGLSNSTKHFLGTLGNNQYFGWTGDVGFSGLNPSSPTTHHLL